MNTQDTEHIEKEKADHTSLDEQTKHQEIRSKRPWHTLRFWIPLIGGVGLLFISALYALITHWTPQPATFRQAYTSPPSTPSRTALVSPTVMSDAETATWRTYTDAHYGFSFRYPPNWTRESGTLIPGTTPLVFTVSGGDAIKDPVRMVVSIEMNDKSWTSEQWFASIITKNNAPDVLYTHVTVAGWPAMKSTQTIAFEEYNVIAPVQNPKRQNAAYTIYFSNIGAGLNNPYALTDPFLQQAYTDFHLVLSSLRIPK